MTSESGAGIIGTVDLVGRPKAAHARATLGVTPIVVAFARRHRHVLAFGVFVLMIGGLYLSVLLGTRSLVTDGVSPPGPLFVVDPAAGGPITAPLAWLESLAWSHLQLPVIDPYQGFGIPLLPDQGVPVYPLQLVAHFLFPHNYSVWNVVNLMLLAFGSYLVASSFGQTFFAAIAVGSAAALAGVAAPNVNLGMVNPLAMLPFVLVAIRYAVDPTRQRHWAALLGTATAIALLGLSGFPEVLPLFAVVIVVYSVALVIHHRTFTQRPWLVAWTVVAATVGVVVGLIGLLPTITVVRGQSVRNVPIAYTSHAPTYWLATLTVPHVAGAGLAGARADLGQSVWTLGTPLLVPAVVLALILAVRRGGRGLGWYVWPSLVFVIFGFLGYADLLHVLTVLDLPFFKSIVNVRFLQFAWWIPWCLLLGAVITGVRALRWYDVAVAAVATALVDLLLVAQYRHALSAAHLAKDAHLANQASVDAAVVAGVFLLLAVIARWVKPTVIPVLPAIMAAVVVASCISYLPTNFYRPSAHVSSPFRSVAKTRAEGRDHLTFYDDPLLPKGLPSRSYVAQIWGPIAPQPYTDMVLAAFSDRETGGRLGPTYGGLPTAALVTPTRRLVTVLRSLGVDTLVTAGELPGAAFGTVEPCSTASTASAPASAGTPGVCFLGQKPPPAGSKDPPAYAYAITGASPLVDPHVTPVAVRSDQAGLNEFLQHVSPTSKSLPTKAYVTSSPAHRLVAARGVSATKRRSTTEHVDMTVHAASAGLAVLRETYVGGMRASINGRRAPALPVDGGLWTAVPVGAGRSHVVLDYVSVADEAEFAFAIVGLGALTLGWLALAGVALRRRVHRRS